MSDEDELLAAELALGLIDGDERRGAERRLGGDPAFARAHARWEAHAATMLGGREEPPRPSLWPRIAARLPANDGAAPAGAAAGARGWKLATLAASAAAALLAVVAIERPVPPAPAAPLVAMLTGDAGNGVVAVSFDPALRRLILTPSHSSRATSPPNSG